MNTKEVVTLIQLTRGVTVFSAMYTNGGQKVYHFKNAVGAPLVEGALCVVETRDSYSLVQVIAPEVVYQNIGCGLDELKHLVQVVNFADLNRVQALEDKAESALAISELHQRLDAYRKYAGSALSDIEGMFTALPSVGDS